MQYSAEQADRTCCDTLTGNAFGPINTSFFQHGQLSRSRGPIAALDKHQVITISEPEKNGNVKKTRTLHSEGTGGFAIAMHY